MPEEWLQIKGDLSVRAFLFEQQRTQCPFDEHLDRVMFVMEWLLLRKGAFHAQAHYSSSQLTRWFYGDPFNYKVHACDEVIAPGLLEFPAGSVLRRPGSCGSVAHTSHL